MSSSSDEDFGCKENKCAAFSPVRKQANNIQIINSQKSSFYPLKANKIDFYNAQNNTDDFYSPTQNRHKEIYAPDRQLIREAFQRETIYRSPQQDTQTPEKQFRMTPAKEGYKGYDNEYFSAGKFDEFD